jgi:hypothetical protein
MQFHRDAESHNFKEGHPMKRTLPLVAVLLLILASSPLLNAQNFKEDFNYGTTGNPDITAVAGSGWVRHSGAQGPTYSATGLTYPGYPGSGVGGALGFTNGGSGNNDGDVNKVFTAGVTTTGTVYLSFLVNIASALPTADYFIHMGPGVIATTFRGRVFARSVGTGWSIGLSKSSEANFVDTTVVLSFAKTYLVVVKYSFNTTLATDDQVGLFVYASGVPASEPGTPVVTIPLRGNGTGSDPSDLGSVAIRQGTNTPTGLVDGIRVATSWNGVLTGVESGGSTLPTEFYLSQNYPNPFNPTTTISYQLPKASNVSLQIFNALGQRVATLVDGQKEAGTHLATWNANVPSGMYLYRLTAGGSTETRSMMLLK